MKTLTFLEALQAGFFAGAAATLLNIGVSTAAAWLTKAPPTFAPFTLLPVVSGSLGGAVFACLVYFGLQNIPSYPHLVIAGVAAAVLLASFNLPYRIMFSPSPRFAGVSLPIQIAQGLMHTVVAALSVVAFLGAIYQKE